MRISDWSSDVCSSDLAGRNDSLNRDALEKNARLLESVLEDFGVRGEIVKVRPGPVVTRYELEPAPGTKTSRVVGQIGSESRRARVCQYVWMYGVGVHI